MLITESRSWIIDNAAKPTETQKQNYAVKPKKLQSATEALNIRIEVLPSVTLLLWLFIVNLSNTGELRETGLFIAPNERRNIWLQSS